MLDQLFSSVLTQELTIKTFLICTAAALILGFLHAVVYMYGSDYSKGYVVTIALLPAIVASVIMMVNGSIGAGVAVAGAFSLVRFRSAPGTAKEICAVFLAMAIGLACGMGYPMFGALFAAVICGIEILYTKLGFGEKKSLELRRTLQITVPEDLNYTNEFDDLFMTYTTEHRLLRIKSVNLGSLNRLTYEIVLRDGLMEKDMIDDIRIRNGNLEITCSAVLEQMTEL